MTPTKDYSGIIVPVITPVDSDDRVDESAFRRMIRYLIDAGVHGVFVGGSAGEGPLLTEGEWVRLMEIAQDEVQGAVYLWGGVMDTSTRRVIAKIKTLAHLGYEAFVVTPTFYTTLRCPEEHLRLFGECVEQSNGMEMIAYNIPAFTYSEIPVDVICQMAQRGWIRHCKESSGNIDYLKNLLSRGKDVGLRVFNGHEFLVAQALLLGACGVVAICSNYEPQTYLHAYRASLRRDREELARLQERIRRLTEALPLAGPCFVAGVKYALSLRGLGSEKPVAPLQPLTVAEKDKVHRLLRAPLEPQRDREEWVAKTDLINP